MLLHELMVRHIDSGYEVFGVSSIEAGGQMSRIADPARKRQAENAFRRIIKFKVDNVAAWFFQEDDREVWDIADPKCFPNMAPPFDLFWMEYATPRVIKSRERTLDFRDKIPKNMRTGVLFDCKRKEPPAEGWFLRTFFYSGGKGLRLNGGDIGALIHLDGNGELERDPAVTKAPYQLVVPEDFKNQTQEAYRSAIVGLSQHVKPCLLAICLLHVKNSIVLDRDFPISKKRRRKREKSGEAISPEEMVYKTIVVDPLRPKVQRVGISQGAPTGRTVEKRRGGWRTYTEKRPLFGKWSGTWFWASIVPDGEKDPLTDPDYEMRF